LEVSKMPRHAAQDPSLSDQQERDFATLVPKQWRASDQVPSGATAPDGSESFLELGPVEPSSRAASGAANLGDQPFFTERPSIGRRMFRGLVRFCIVFLMGVAATLTWQSEGDQAIELVRTAALTWGPAWAMEWIPEARVPTTGSLSSVSSANPPAVQAQSTPVAQTLAPGAAPPPESVRQIETMARDLSGVRHSIEQLAARQEDMAQNIVTLQAAEQDIKQKIVSLPRPAPVPRRKPPQPATQSAATQPSTTPPPAAPSSAAPSSSAPTAPSVPRPPAPLH
jgi:hypothetical protein